MAATRVAIRVKPGSSRTRVGGTYGDAIIVAVQAKAVGGKATEAALMALAKALDVPRRDVRLISGATSRSKVVQVIGSDEVLGRIQDLRSGAAR
jgi:uncharacterized protein YggU (UPF0235/DUF167 family)